MTCEINQRPVDASAIKFRRMGFGQGSRHPSATLTIRWPKRLALTALSPIFSHYASDCRENERFSTPGRDPVFDRFARAGFPDLEQLWESDPLLLQSLLEDPGAELEYFLPSMFPGDRLEAPIFIDEILAARVTDEQIELDCKAYLTRA